LIRLARSVPAYAVQLGFLAQLSPGRVDPPALLVVEFGGDNPVEMKEHAGSPKSEYFNPQVGLAAVRVLNAAGCKVKLVPVIGAGRTLISKGFLKAAKRHAQKVVEAINHLDPKGEYPIVGVEPSEIVALHDEYLDLLPGEERIQLLSGRAFMIDEFLIRPTKNNGKNTMRIANIHQIVPKTTKPKILLHKHCYQKSRTPISDQYLSGIQATVAMLSASGYHVEVIESGCCGVAGTPQWGRWIPGGQWSVLSGSN
jgi:Fe-S oxidoreductase